MLYSVAFFVYMFAMRSTYHCLGKCVQCKLYVILCLMVLSVIVFAGFVIIYLLLLFVPINLATEDGPTRINSINQTILALITTAVTYKLFFKHDKHELVQILINAKDKIEPAWRKRLKKRKKEEMEKLL